MTAKERINAILSHQKDSQVGVFEHFWPETIHLWQQEGKLKEDEIPELHFDLDILLCGTFDLKADIVHGEQIIEETQDTKLVKDGNYATLRFWKNKSGTPEHLGYEVNTFSEWENKIKPFLIDKSLLSKRIKLDLYKERKKLAIDNEKFFCINTILPFELMHPVCGHEQLLMAMALEPDWIHDMCSTYINLLKYLYNILFEQAGIPDGLWFYEDMGFKNKPFMSPDFYKRLIQPYHKELFDFAHCHNLPVIVHSCGFVEPLIPGLIEAGIDCLQAIEVKAGMNLVDLKRKFGDKIALCGGLDIRILEENNISKLKEYMDNILPDVYRDGHYILHTDHSIPPSVSYETYKFFVNYGKELACNN